MPYHGELFVNAETGIVVRLVVQGEFKSSDVIHYEDTRIDYGPVDGGRQDAGAARWIRSPIPRWCRAAKTLLQE